MKRVLMLDPSIASANLGDMIIKKAIKDNFPEIFDGNYVYDLPTHTRSFSWYQKLLYPQRMEMYRNADLKFLCGTNALYTNMLRPMPTWNINILNYDLMKGTILLGVGLGVNSRNVNLYTKSLLSSVLSHEYIHSVRDNDTKEFLNNLGFEAINTGCPTLWGFCDHAYNFPVQKAHRCIFSLTNYLPNQELDSRMIDILHHNYEELLFWPQCYDDLNYLYSITNCPVQIISPDLDCFDEILKGGDIDYVGNRLHGGIYALQHNVRSLIVSIDYRARNMHKTYGIPCVERDLINERLEELINSDTTISISGINSERILEWKRQFDE